MSQKNLVLPKSFKENRQIISSTILSSGVTHTNEIIHNFMNKKSNLQNINYIEMDLNLINSSYSIMCSKSKGITNGKETLMNQILNENKNGVEILGAINGDFFNLINGIPVCNNIINGEFFSTSLTKDEEILRPCFGIFENETINIDHYHFNGKINFINKLNYKTSVKIDSINRNDYIENTINIFNFKNNNNSSIYFPKEKEDALLILIEPDDGDTSFKNLKTIKGKITNIIQDPEQTYKISKNQIALVAYNDKRHLLPHLIEGMNVEINFEIRNSTNYSIHAIKHLITAHEFIIKNGIIQNKDYFSKTWSIMSAYSKNHRSAIALTDRNTLIFLTVDKKDSFKGMSLPEVGEFLKSKNAHTAINLDGGGSTSMIIKDTLTNEFKISNLPREDRAISNSIMIKRIQN